MIESTLSLEAMPGGMIAVRSVDNCSELQASQTAIINIVVKRVTEQDDVKPSIQINNNEVGNEDCVTYHTFNNGDGLYEVFHYVINSAAIEDGKIGGQEITVATLNSYIETLSPESYGFTQTLTVSIYELHECYRKVANEIFKRRDICDTKAYSDLIYKRDMVWMAINVINYMIDNGQTELIESLLKKLHSCHGICKTINKTNKGCGCS